METFQHKTNIPESPESKTIDESLPSLDDSPPVDYQILKEFRETTYKWVTDEKLRKDYLSLTANLVDTITQGIEVTDETTGEKQRQPYSTVIFLDRSARPLSHLVRETWPRFAKDPASGTIADMPDMKFLNISRKHWIEQLDPNGAGLHNVDNIDKNTLKSLRSIFLTPESKQQLKDPDTAQDINNLPATLDDETILIVDETKSTGGTIRIATDFMRRAFPTARIDGTYWIDERVNGVARNPVWDTDRSKDNEASEAMKGVGARYADLGSKAISQSSRSSSYVNTGGRENFISSPLSNNDAYRELISEIKALAIDRSVPVEPSFRRGESDESYENRLLAYTYDVDVSALTQDQKDQLLKDTYTRIRDIRVTAEKFNP